MTSATTVGRGGSPVLVLGATGGQGGAVARSLLTSGVPVRAMVRRPDSGSARRLAAAGVAIVPGDLVDEAALAVAMRGVRALFAVTTPFEQGVDAVLTPATPSSAAARRSRWNPECPFS